MTQCRLCGHMNQSDSGFCSGCGKPLDSQPTRSEVWEGSEPAKVKKNRGKMYLALSLAAILVVALFTGYQMLSKKYSKDVVIDQFKTALAQKDKQSLKELIQPSDTRLKVNDQSLDALFALIDKNPSINQEIENSLRGESLANKLFFLREDGKHLGIFTKYAVDTPGYFVDIKSTGKPTNVYLGLSEIGVIENANEQREFGPFLAGTYTVKGSSPQGSGTKEDQKTVDLSGAKTRAAVALATGTTTATKTKKEKKETTVVKEVIREVPARSTPTSSFMYISDSHYRYLDGSDVAGLTSRELRLARNEIYARHGYMFESKDLQNYFNNQTWYTPDPSFDGTLSPLEKANVDFIKSYE